MCHSWVQRSCSQAGYAACQDLPPKSTCWVDLGRECGQQTPFACRLSSGLVSTQVPSRIEFSVCSLSLPTCILEHSRLSAYAEPCSQQAFCYKTSCPGCLRLILLPFPFPHPFQSFRSTGLSLVSCTQIFDCSR